MLSSILSRPSSSPMDMHVDGTGLMADASVCSIITKIAHYYMRGPDSIKPLLRRLHRQLMVGKRLALQWNRLQDLMAFLFLDREISARFIRWISNVTVRINGYSNIYSMYTTLIFELERIFDSMYQKPQFMYLIRSSFHDNFYANDYCYNLICSLGDEHYRDVLWKFLTIRVSFGFPMRARARGGCMPNRLCNTLELISPAAAACFPSSSLSNQAWTDRLHLMARVVFFRSDNIAVSADRRSGNTNKPLRTTIHAQEANTNNCNNFPNDCIKLRVPIADACERLRGSTVLSNDNYRKEGRIKN